MTLQNSLDNTCVYDYIKYVPVTSDNICSNYICLVYDAHCTLNTYSVAKWKILILNDDSHIYIYTE